MGADNCIGGPSATPKWSPVRSPAMTDADLTQAAVRTYLYGYPMLYNLDETRKVFEGSTTLVDDAGPNRFGPARRLLGPEAKFVTPNNDTLYLIAACDVSAGPLVLDVPDTADRYYVLQFVDAWSNNFAYVGRRATGTKAGRYLLTAPGAGAVAPAGMTVVEAPSTVFAIVGRIQVNSDADLAAVHALQDQFALTPLAVVQGGVAPGVGAGLPAPAAGVADDLLWWEQFRVALRAFPPPAGDSEFVAAAASLGLTDAQSPFIEPDPALRKVLVDGLEQGRATVENLSRNALKIVDGWSSAMHAFDYNLDRLGLGTVDAPEWKIADRKNAYLLRAAAARAGLWGNHGYEARYDLLWQDEHGELLDGAHAYELTLSPAPSVDAFWSLTMYDEPDYHLVANPIDRYSIGDRTPGLVTAADGSVTLRLQRVSPGADQEANWLPAPAGRFRPVLRSYQPSGSMLSGDYVLPKVRRLG